ncbi:Exo-beta-1,3-glucanase, partial [Stachybotrys elegans]
SKWPYGPFHTEGRDIVNARGEKITFVGINWPMSGETMIPEGLEKRSAKEIVDDIAALGMNFIRMGWSATMVDEIYESNGRDVPMEKALVQGLGAQNGTRVARQILEHNPQWSKRSGRFDIWSDVVRLAARRGIYVHPDMHMAKAAWCCSHTDGSAWFGDRDFDVDKWTRALAYVAGWASGHDNIVSMALVNEPRQPWVDNYPRFHYGWPTLVGNMSLGSDAIHAANPDLLISWSGLQYDEDLSAVTSGLNLWEAPCYMCVATRDAPRRDPWVFDLGEHAWGDKVFYELHLYPMSEDLDVGTCSIIKAQLYRAGFNALGMAPPADCALLEGSSLGPCREAVRQTPVLMTEFGAAQDASLLSDAYTACLREFTTENHVGWAVWSLAGSFRARSGGQDVDDTWGLKSFDWKAWRFQEGIEEVYMPWIEDMNVTR